MELAVAVYEVVTDFPKEEKYGLTSQIKRSAISIPSNIAEGAGRNNPQEFFQFLGIANGSSFELQTQIILAQKLNLISEDFANNILEKNDEIQKMIFGFQKTLKSK